MKRDMDLVRKILLEVEELPGPRPKLRELEIEGCDEVQVQYHLKLMSDAGLIDTYEAGDPGKLKLLPQGLTWDGHDFLDAAREESRWRKAMASIKQKAGAVSFEVVKQVLVSIAKDQLGL